MSWPRKHQFVRPDSTLLQEHARCQYCEETTDLSSEQTAKMLPNLSVCESHNAPRLSLLELIYGTVDCRGTLTARKAWG